MVNIKIDWSHITIFSVIAFVAGWLIFGLLGAYSISCYCHGVNGDN